MKITLCVIFNHPYPKNIPLIKEMVSDKFDNIIFVQPFLSSERNDVVVSHRGSYNFQGMMVDAISRLEQMQTDYVVFMQDDCLLNPFLDQDNILRELGVSEDVPYFPHFMPLSGSIENWLWTLPTVWKLFYNSNVLSGTGVENYARYLPDAIMARQHLVSNYGLQFAPITNVEKVTRAFGAVADPQADKRLTRVLVEGLFKTAPDGVINLEYPWLYGTSDFSVMSFKSLKRIERFLGVTAAANIFVEVAFPTALAVYHDILSTSHSTGWSVNYVWEGRENVSADGALASFANKCAMLHPVKLSTQFNLANDVIRRFKKENIS